MEEKKLNHTNNKTTNSKVIQKDIGNTKYTVNIFCKKNGIDLKDKMKTIIKQEIAINKEN